MSSEGSIKVAELFAGVGGFRLALDGYNNPNHPEFKKPYAGPFQTVWANQWEPPGTVSKQFAWRCYEKRFGEGSCVNEDISKVLDEHEAGTREIPDVEMVVGGFPCQDYSVAKPLSLAGGIEGKKGTLWWDIYRFLDLKEPKYVLLENVDRLLKSPASQRGRDFAIMLSCFANLGYSVEWRDINSAEYGFDQRRKRVYIYAEKNAGRWNLDESIEHGVISSAFPVKDLSEKASFDLDHDPYEITQSFGKGLKKSPFGVCGAMQEFSVLTCNATEDFRGEKGQLGNIIIPAAEVPASFYIPSEKVPNWQYLKGSKREKRIDKKTGYEYYYSEGSMAFPDLLENPSRTILTGEGGSGASRFKHVILTEDGRYRRLTPDELDQLQYFPKGWTDIGMTDGQRAFCMGNALVVGIPHLIGIEIAKRKKSQS
ncbi:DNA (cytosine-5-)-methyltransferase [Eggerthellaceae bacterium zg-1084]|uniref:DNA (cytosine-5-)-methyltransferase n=1 Tax=Berryella wangjianweii TaxID=2734634 RepID=UPI00155657EC|nr:DNA (cytosine-5-)-methyltransferase [Berryella wangjianweii]NPD30391.1 DNA (cytosine-5-)-methyltransferase [Berryella wangjianweii]